MGWTWPVVSALVASAGALVGSALVLAFGRRARTVAAWLLPGAVGTLLGAAALVLLPEAIEAAPATRVGALFLAGILAFAVLERVIRRRSHEELAHGPEVERVPAVLVLGGDTLHNLVDGLVLGVVAQTDPSVAISTALAVIAHEVPQEVGDFAVLLASGMKPGRAFAWNGLSALATVPGAVLGYAGAASLATGLSGWLLPLAAGGFVYVALADLMPALLHRRGAAAWAQLVLVIAGAALIGVLGQVLGAA